MRFTPSSDIILIGSIKVGKEIIAKLLDDQFATPKVLLDGFHRKFYAKVAFIRHRPFLAFQ
jgi:hypothetical protein